MPAPRRLAKVMRRRLAAAPPPPPAPASAPASAPAPLTFSLPLRSHLPRQSRSTRRSEAIKDDSEDSEDRSDDESDDESEGPAFSALQSGFQNATFYNGRDFSGNKANKAKQLLQFQHFFGSKVSEVIAADIAPKDDDGEVKPEVSWKLTLLSSLAILSKVWVEGADELNRKLREKVTARRQVKPKSKQQVRASEVDELREEVEAEMKSEEESEGEYGYEDDDEDDEVTGKRKGDGSLF